MKASKPNRALRRLQSAGGLGLSAGTVCTLPAETLERIWDANAHLRQWAEQQYAGGRFLASRSAKNSRTTRPASAAVASRGH